MDRGLGKDMGEVSLDNGAMAMYFMIDYKT